MSKTRGNGLKLQQGERQARHLETFAFELLRKGLKDLGCEEGRALPAPLPHPGPDLSGGEAAGRPSPSLPFRAARSSSLPARPFSPPPRPWGAAAAAGPPGPAPPARGRAPAGGPAAAGAAGAGAGAGLGLGSAGGECRGGAVLAAAGRARPRGAAGGRRDGGREGGAEPSPGERGVRQRLLKSPGAAHEVWG